VELNSAQITGVPVEVADGVHVIPDNRAPLVPNVGIIVGDEAALVVDTGLGPRNGRYVLAQARRLAGHKPLYLTMTHFHPEHGFGAQAFKGAATIIYNQEQRAELHRKGAAYHAMFSQFSPEIAAELKDVEFVEPDITFHGHRDLDLGGRHVTLTVHGPAHTVGDQTVHVDGVLFGGDLLETRMFPLPPHFPPFDTDADAHRWIIVLDDLASRNPAIVVPGHGEIADVTLINDVRDYLTYVRDEVASGAAPEDIEQAVRTRWDWDNPQWIPFAIRAF
jgi:glyoxylase-like metal-dependent hydrolase (beta-lactamase superfamily II)